MVDVVSTTTYSYDAAGPILSEDGPCADDTVSYTYDNTGQLQPARDTETGGATNRLHEQLGYVYGVAGGRLARFMTLLAVLSATPLALAYYDPGVQRWINRDPLGEPGFEVVQRPGLSDRVWRVEHRDQASWINPYAFVANRIGAYVDALGLQWISILFPPSTGGNNYIKCALVSETAPITGATPGKHSLNGQSLCIWRCSVGGDEIPKTTTVITLTTEPKPCQPPKCGNRKTPVVPYRPTDWGDDLYE